MVKDAVYFERLRRLEIQCIYATSASLVPMSKKFGKRRRKKGEHSLLPSGRGKCFFGSRKRRVKSRSLSNILGVNLQYFQHDLLPCRANVALFSSIHSLFSALALNIIINKSCKEKRSNCNQTKQWPYKKSINTPHFLHLCVRFSTELERKRSR